MTRPAYLPKLEDGEHECPSCGETLKGDAKHETVMRVVRRGQKYGTAKAGAFVEIEPRHLTQNAEIATMSLAEHEMLEQAVAKAKEPKPRGRLAQMVESGLEAMIAATRAEIARNKEAAELDARLASEARAAQ